MAELSRLIEPHAIAVLSFACAFSETVVTPLDIESGGFHFDISTDVKHNYKGNLAAYGADRRRVEVMALF